MTTIVSGSSITFNDNTTQNTSAYGGGFAFRNRIINGDMRIDQRNAGASVTPTNGAYTLDRWVCTISQTSKFTVQQNAGSVTPPTGFKNYLGITSSSAYTVLSSDYFFLSQRIEGYNIADLGWGASGASTVTISFWVRSSLTGTFGGAITNDAENRSYPFSYTISSANTWEQKTITITGDTTGTWLTTTGTGLEIFFGLGVGSTYSGTANAWVSSGIYSVTGATSVVGTNGATFYITGVQLEKGSTATSFDYRPYGQELALCQRYCPIFTAGSADSFMAVGYNASSTIGRPVFQFPVQTRVQPTGVTVTSATSFTLVPTFTAVTSITFSESNQNYASLNVNVSSGLSSGGVAVLRTGTSTCKIEFTGCEL